MNSAPCAACGQPIYDSTVVNPPDEIPCDECGHERVAHCKSSMRATKWFCMEKVLKGKREIKCKCQQLR